LNDKISDKDKKDWKDFLSSNEKLPNKDNKLNTSLNVKIKHIDLHGFTLQEANKTIEKFINNSYDHNVSKIIVVTGKGLHSSVEKDPYVSKDLSILKYSVPDFIENNPDIMKKVIEIKDAEVKDGGSGAFYIFLKKKNNKPKSEM
jgi:DNA-nicking Smr family endonuclease